MNTKIDKANVQDILELSMMQKGMLFHHLRDAGENTYNVQITFDLEGNPEPHLLREAFEIVQSKNEALRSVFSWQKTEKPLQIVLKNCQADFQYHDFSRMQPEQAADSVHAILEKDRNLRFDLTGLALRVQLIKTAPAAWVFNITHHHILYDGWSTAILMQELVDCYHRLQTRQPPAIAPKPALREVRQIVNSRQLRDAGSRFWEQYLKDCSISSFPAESTTPEAGGEVQKHSISVYNNLLADFPGKYKVTQASVVYAAFSILQWKYSDVPDIIFGTTVSGRDPSVSGCDRLIDNFINTVPLRVTGFEDRTLLDIVASVNKDIIERSQFSHTSYPDIKRLLRLTPAENLFDAVLVIENYPIDDSLFNRNNHFSIRLRSDYENTDFPLAVKIFFRDALEIEFVYKKQFAGQAFIEAMGSHFAAIIHAILRNPETKANELNLLTGEEEHALLVACNNTDVPLPEEETIVTLFEKQVASAPAAIAQQCCGKSLTYMELNELSNKVACCLATEYGITNGDLAGIMLERDHLLVPCILGILKAGAAYVPIDPAYPAERIQLIAKDAGLKAIITSKKLQPLLEGLSLRILDTGIIFNETANAQPATLQSPDPAGLAYVIYTSGSTGRPKGVMIEHHSLVNYITWAAGQYVRNEKLSFALYTSISFDLTVTSIFLPLVTGGTIIVYGDDENALLIEKVFEDNQADVVKLTPSHLKILRDCSTVKPASQNKVRRLIAGGEDLETQLAGDIYRKFEGQVEIYNEYGPTEATVGCMIHRFDPLETGASVPIGLPVSNARIYILDSRLLPMPVGIKGEIYISGSGVARGYLGQEALTRQRFLDNPFVAGERMYRTGDLAVRTSGGAILFRGRADDQLKVRGYRIEPAEIEAQIRNYKETSEEILPELTERIGREEVTRCKNCLLTANYPGITFNKDGICNICQDYFSKKEFIDRYFRDQSELATYFKNREPSNGQYDCLLLFSGGKDSTYTLYQLLDLGLKVLTFTFDNGFISKAAFQNIKNITEQFNVPHITRTTAQIHQILLESLKTKQNACTGCWNSINSLGIQVAQEFGIDTIVSGLSRGQIIEMRLEGLLEAGILNEQAIDDNLQLFRKSFHSRDNVFFSLLNSNIDVEFLSRINFIDYFRYDGINTSGVVNYLLGRGWVQPKDTGLCSTNCMVNDAGVYVHWKKKGYHFYEAPLSWDSRLQVVDREKAIHELSDTFNLKKIGTILKRVGYYDPVTIKDVIVTLKKNSTGSRYLVAYFVATATVSREQLRNYLQELLPDYMIPQYFVQLEKMPLSPNGKIDRNALPVPDVKHTGAHVLPVTKKEKLLAEICSRILGIKNISIADNFFSLGGDSIKSIQISSRLRSVGYDLPVKDILTNQPLRQLAAGIKEIALVSDQAAVTGEIPLTPVQLWFLANCNTAHHHFNQSVVLQFPNGISIEMVRRIFTRLQEHHDALRMVFRGQGHTVVQYNCDVDLPVEVWEYDLRQERDAAAEMERLCNGLQGSINLQEGPLMKGGLFHISEGSRLLIVIHHLVVDGVSWRVLLEDIDTLYGQLLRKEPLVLPLKTDSYGKWSQALGSWMQTEQYGRAKTYWSRDRGEGGEIRRDHPEGRNLSGASRQATFRLSAETTERLLRQAQGAFHTQINDLLLTGLLLSLEEEYGIDRVWVDLESHGRTERVGANISRTVGWFTGIYPVLLEKKGSGPGEVIRHVKETLRQVPHNGLDYLIIRYLDKGEGALPAAHSQPAGRISFNYLGRFDIPEGSHLLVRANDPKGAEMSPDITQPYDWNFIGIVDNGQLEMKLVYSPQQYYPETIHRILQAYKEKLEALTDFCCTCTKVMLSPSDLTWPRLTMEQLDALQQQYDLEDVYPLSAMQEGMLYHYLLDTGAAGYFQQKTLFLKGNMQVAAVEKSFNDLIARYDILRTVFLHKGYHRPVQVVLKHRKIEFTYVDLRRQPAAGSLKSTIQAYQLRDKSKTFDPGKDVLMRATVLQTGHEDYVLIWSHHHILMDGWCTTIIWNDFLAYYRRNTTEKKPELPPAGRYAAYIRWLEEKDKREAMAWWTGYLAGYNTPAKLPQQEALQVNGLPYQLESQLMVLNNRQSASIRRVCGELGTTLNTLLLSAWGLLLAKYNNHSDVVFGNVVSGRSPEIDGIEKMVGLFINTVPVRVQYEETQAIGDLASRMHHELLQSEPHQYLPLSEIQSVAGPGRDLFDHIMVFENYPGDGEITDPAHTAENGFTISQVEVFEQTNYDLAIVVLPGAEIRLRMDYNANRYAIQTIEKLIVLLHRIIDQVIANPGCQVSAIEILPEGEKYQLLKELDFTSVGYPSGKTIVHLFEEQVRRTPGNIAVKDGNRNITYAELHRRADQLAALLQSKGAQRNHIVALLMDRSAEMIVAMLGILKAGAAYLPVDVDYPDSRINYLINDSGAHIIVTTRRFATHTAAGIEPVFIEDLELLADSLPAPTLVSTPSDLCYIIYTSGTTGNPKGVMVEHRNVVRLFFNDAFQFDFGPDDTWTLFHSHCFDFSVWEIFGALLFGGRLIIIPKITAMDTRDYLRILQDEAVTVLNQTPGAFNNLVHEVLDRSHITLSLRYVIFGGEALVPRKLKSWHAQYPSVKLINMFGITETTVHVTYKEIGSYEIENNISNIGKPIPTLSVYILDRHRQLLPKGVVGELCVGGAGVARGYLGREELTRQKFIDNPWKAGEKLYRSGDLARILPNGDIEYMGRIDDQVKIRGFRIELGEIENQLSAWPGIDECIVLAKERASTKYLVAWYVAGSEIAAPELKTFLRSRLPDYMVPDHFVHLLHLPLTSNGKVDKKSLPGPELKDAEIPARPSNDIQKSLVKIWADLLQIEENKIGIHTNFFDIGGNSLKLVRMADSIHRIFKVPITVAQLFTYPVIASLAEFLRAGKGLQAGEQEADMEGHLQQMNETINLLNQK